jgi:hypothetical protein
VLRAARWARGVVKPHASALARGESARGVVTDVTSAGDGHVGLARGGPARDRNPRQQVTAMQMGLGRGEPGRNRITRQQVTAMRDGLSKGAYPQGIVILISR